MLRLILGMSLLLITMSVAQGVEVDVTGYGDTVEKAVENAKINAANKATSSFISSKQTLTNNNYKEVIAAYSGGFVRKVQIKHINKQGSLYKAYIIADVDIDKINEVISTSSSIDPGRASDVVQAVLSDKDQLKKAWGDLKKVSDPFVLKTVGSKFEVNRYNEVVATFTVEVSWNPKWVSDAKDLSLASWRNINSDSEVVCIKNTGWFHVDDYDCKSMLVRPTQNDFTMSTIAATFTRNNNEVEVIRDDVIRNLKRLWKNDTVKVTGPESEYVPDLAGLYILANEYARFDITYKMSPDELKNLQDVELTLE